jgi:hypothetical protein
LLPPADGYQSRGNLADPTLRRQQIELCGRISRVLYLEPYAEVIEVSAHGRRNRHDSRPGPDDEKIRLRMRQLQDAPAALAHVPLASAIHQFPRHRVVSQRTFPHASWPPPLCDPRPPPERFAAEEHYAAAGNPHLVVQREAVARARVDGGGRCNRVAQYVERTEVGLRVFVRLGAAVSCFGRLGLKAHGGCGVETARWCFNGLSR